MMLEKNSMAAIARTCGVSKMTVSRVLRNDPNVSELTRLRVIRAAEKTGFLLPNTRRGSGRAISIRHFYILFQQDYSLNDAYFSEIILSVQGELFQRGFGCSLAVVKDDYSDFIKLSNIIRSSNTSGVFVAGEIPNNYAEALQKTFINLVFVDYPGDPDIRGPYQAICTDQLFGAQLAIRYLLRLGRKRILLMCGKPGHYFTNDLIQAYRMELGKLDMEVTKDLITYGDFHVSGGYESTKRALKEGIEFDAVLSNDEMACGAMRAITEHGLAIPEDVSVVGFDGLPMGEIVSPRLTTIVVDRAMMGRLAVERLLALNETSPVLGTAEKISLYPKLLIRESCGGKSAAIIGGNPF